MCLLMIRRVASSLEEAWSSAADLQHFQDSVRHIRKVFACGVQGYGLNSNVGGWMKQWRFRQRHWASSKELRRPDFNFQSFVTALDACRANKQVPGWKSNHFLLNTAFFCNTNRIWDAAFMELQAVLPSFVSNSASVAGRAVPLARQPQEFRRFLEECNQIGPVHPITRGTFQRPCATYRLHRTTHLQNGAQPSRAG